MKRCRPSCTNTVRPDQAFCRSCWKSLPFGMRDEIWRYFRNGRGSRAHLTALATARDWLEGHRERPVPGL